MGLPGFIESNIDSLVDEWAEFASQIGLEGDPLSSRELQDSARMMLARIAADMRTSQNAAQQKAKSRGERSPASDVNEAAQVHADDRLSQGFKLDDVVAEFRALRATVLRRWANEFIVDAAAFEEVIRFNEAIDQTLSESVRQYTMQVESTRDRFAGVLAHDLRSPLGSIANSAQLILLRDDTSLPCMKAAANVQRSATRMKKMVDDLLDYTRTRLGDTLPVDRQRMDVGRLCTYASDEVVAAYPNAEVDVRLLGDLMGDWDSGRISQLMANLIVNAIQHGTSTVRVCATGEDRHVTLAVSNAGTPIPTKALPTLFDPLTRSVSSAEKRGVAAGIGLGLYICKRIAQAHHGKLDVTSNAQQTTFTVTLPRFSGATP